MLGFFKKKKKPEPFCKNCRLFDAKNRACRVVILHEGQRVNLPMDAEDPCFFEEPYFDPKTGETTDFNEVRQVRFWTEDKNGKKTNKDGTVKMEYPDGFLGDGKTLRDLLG